MSRTVLQMPGLNGWGISERLRATAANPMPEGTVGTP